MFPPLLLLIPQSLLFNAADEEEKGIFAISTKVFVLLLGSFHGGRSRALCERGGFLLHPGWYLCNATMNQKSPPAADKAIKIRLFFDGQGFGGGGHYWLMLRAKITVVFGQVSCVRVQAFFSISVSKATLLERKK